MSDNDIEIEAGQLFIPKGEQYPHKAVHIETLKGEDVKFFNMNGGWRQSLPQAKFLKIFREVTEEEKANPQPYPSTFGIDDYFEPPVEGYTKGFLWNGWAQPYFELDEAMRIAKQFGDMTYDKERDVFIADTQQYYPDEPNEEFAGEDLVVNGEVKRVYAIGAGAWTWDDLGPSAAQKAKARKERHQDLSGDSPAP